MLVVDVVVVVRNINFSIISNLQQIDITPERVDDKWQKIAKQWERYEDNIKKSGKLKVHRPEHYELLSSFMSPNNLINSRNGMENGPGESSSEGEDDDADTDTEIKGKFIKN